MGHPDQVLQRGTLALLNLASSECAKRNLTGPAGTQNDLIFLTLMCVPFLESRPEQVIHLD